MEQYAIDGDTYLTHPSRLYRVTDTTHSLEQIEEDTVYLYDGSIVKIRTPADTIHTSVKLTPLDPDYRERYELPEEFGTATVLEGVIPKDAHECPECGSMAGRKSTFEEPHCFSCGYEGSETLDLRMTF